MPVGLFVKELQPASVQLEAIFTRWIPGCDTLVVNKLTHLDVFKWNPVSYQLSKFQSIELEKNALSICAVQNAERDRSTVLALLTNGQVLALECPNVEGLSKKFQAIMVDKYSLPEDDYYTDRQAPNPKILVDPKHQFVLSCSTQGFFSIFFMSQENSSRNRKVRMPMFNVIDFIFLENDSSDTRFLAILWEDNGQKIVSTYSLDLEAIKLEAVNIISAQQPGHFAFSEIEIPDPGTDTLIPIPFQDSVGGILLVGEDESQVLPILIRPSKKKTDSETGKVKATRKDKGKGKATDDLLSEGRRSLSTAAFKCSVAFMKAWCLLKSNPEDGSFTFLIGDKNGKLIIAKVTGREISLRHIGFAASPESFTLLSNSGHVHIASRFGDSQLIQVAFTRNGWDISLIQAFTSIAPILDGVIIHKPNEQQRLVTCSGAFHSGSLRVIRRGIGFQPTLELEFGHVRQIFYLKMPKADYLVCSSFNSTRVLAINGLEEGDPMVKSSSIFGFSTNSTTIHASVWNNGVVQITPHSACFITFDRVLTATWDTEQTITFAASLDDGLVLSTEGGILHFLNKQLEVEQTREFHNEISALEIIKVESINYVVVSFWTSNSVEILLSPDLDTLSSVNVGVHVTCLNLIPAATGANLLIGTKDGTFLYYPVLFSGLGLAIDSTHPQRINLGTTPVSIWGTKQLMFATSNYATLIKQDNLKIETEILNYENVVTGAVLQNFWMAVATPKSLLIGTMSNDGALNIQTVSLGEDEPVKITHNEKINALGVLAKKRVFDAETGHDRITSSFLILDDTSLESKARFALHAQEQCATSFETGFIIGSTQHDEHFDEIYGELTVLFLNGNEVEVSNTLRIAGCPYAILELDPGYFAVGINSSVQLFFYDLKDSSFDHLMTWDGVFFSHRLVRGSGNTLIVGDALRSAAILTFQCSTDSPRLEEELRSFDSLYTTAVEEVNYGEDVDFTEYIGAETNLSMYLLNKNLHTSLFQMNELVVKFCPGSLNQIPAGALSKFGSPILFMTVSGTIGIITPFQEDTLDGIKDLQDFFLRNSAQQGTIDRTYRFFGEKWLNGVFDLPLKEVEAELKSAEEVTRTVQLIGDLHRS